ncbi:uncharacterized protein LOC133761968 [Lepus europaeus]|uniref:uncharacterized protein LOC133761968 n=1 Tax=Lepus europaeus TaxID=9983 RepID=UPI002B498D7A|nr:uncharacterized protein LOC133761968 [Lepus europaeus]
MTELEGDKAKGNVAQTLERVVIISPRDSKPGRVPISKAETRHWTGSKFSRRERFFQVPSLPAQGPGPCTQSSAPGTAPHFRSLRPGTQQGLVPGEGLVSSSFLSVPHLRRPLRPPGAEHGGRQRAPTWSLSHAASARESPPGPGRRRSPPRRPGRPSRGPPEPPGRREGPGSPKEVSGLHRRGRSHADPLPSVCTFGFARLDPHLRLFVRLCLCLGHRCWLLFLSVYLCLPQRVPGIACALRAWQCASPKQHAHVPSPPPPQHPFASVFLE